jgi:cytoskeletal protein CcmA (bactofilin family)
MFKNWNQNEEDINETAAIGIPAEKISIHNTNTILKGSKLIGDINITCDLELSGDIEGNITSLKDSSIVIKGACKGNIETKEGSVSIEGSLNSGNITAGGDVFIAGSFNGGKINSQGKVLINGDFEGSLEASEIDIGPNAKGHAEIVYRDFISISRGARIEGNIQHVQSDIRLVKNTSDASSSNAQRDVKKAGTSA